MGELHLEVTRNRMQREFNVAAFFGRPRVSYRETIAARGVGKGELKSASAMFWSPTGCRGNPSTAENSGGSKPAAGRGGYLPHIETPLFVALNGGL